MLLLVLLPLLGPAACVSLRPFEEVRREQLAERFVAVDGRQVYVEQQGTGEAVLLLHGFGESSYTWRQVMPELARSFRVVALDLNGFGWTERPSQPESYTREGQERLILGVLRALGISRAQFVGHSYGGSLTLFLASRHPELVRSMVLIDSAAATYPQDRRTRLAAVRSLDNLLLRLALRPSRVSRSLRESFHEPNLVTPDLVRAYLDRLRVQGEGDAFYGLTAPLRHSPAEKRALAFGLAAGDIELEKLNIPTLVVWGADDRVILPGAGKKAAARLPQSEFVTIADAGHLPMEERPAELLRLLVPFLSGHRGTAPDSAKAGLERRGWPEAEWR